MSWRDKGRPHDNGYVQHSTGIKTWYYWAGANYTWCSSYRHPRTRQETIAWDPEYGRASRSPARLPDHRWETMRSTWGNDSWKRYRKTRYKPKG